MGTKRKAPAAEEQAQGPKVNWKLTLRRPFRRQFLGVDVDAALARLRREALCVEIQEDPQGEEATPCPIESFEELGLLPPWAMQALREDGRLEPSPLQAQALPILAAGQSLLATGSGRSAAERAVAYLLPAIVHARDQRALSEAEPGPVVVIVVPTTDVADEVLAVASSLLTGSQEAEAVRGHTDGLRALNVSGATTARQEKVRQARSAHFVIGTSKRLTDMALKGQLSLLRVTMLVVDGTDRLLGAAQELGDLDTWIRPERQTAVFAQKSSKELRDLASQLCYHGGDPVRIRVAAVAQPPAAEAAAAGEGEGEWPAEAEGGETASAERGEDAQQPDAEAYPDGW